MPLKASSGSTPLSCGPLGSELEGGNWDQPAAAWTFALNFGSNFCYYLYHLAEAHIEEKLLKQRKNT